MPDGIFPKSVRVYFTYPSCAHRKRLGRGGPLKKNLEADWMTPDESDLPDLLLLVEPVDNSSRLPIGVRSNIRCVPLPRGELSCLAKVI